MAYKGKDQGAEGYLEEGLGFNQPHSFDGLIRRLVFRNQENGYSILELEGETDHWTLVGVMPHLAAGDRVSGQGILVDHPSYGPQIQVTSVIKEAPKGKQQIEIYLASGAVKGIGPATAKKLVAAFGDQTLTVMRHEPERLVSLRGISARKAQDFSRQLKEDGGFQDLLLLLLPYGIGPARIHRIHKTLGALATDIIRADPYLLAARVPGIGFLTADKIASELGMAGDHPARLRGALLFFLNEALFRDGHTVQSVPDLIADLAPRLEVEDKGLQAAIQALIEEGDLVRPADLAASWQEGQSPFDPDARPLSPAAEGPWSTAVKDLVKDSLLHQDLPQAAGPDPDLVSLADVARIEWALAQRAKELAQAPAADKRFFPIREAAREIDKVAREEHFVPGEEQYQALMMALTQPFSVLTGGPGTGKTTIIRLLTRILDRKGEKVLLAAPTGRAARRLAEVCGMPAQTLHRLLALQVQEDRVPDAAFWLSADPLSCDTLIVDESSMIDLFLFTHLLSAVKPGTRLLLIGDADQLPSIGPGQVLRDILLAGTMPRIRLTRIFRQEAHKLIVSNAHRILEGQNLELDQSLESDFIFIDCPDDQAMHEGVVKLCGRVLPEYYGTDGFQGAQVLSAIRRGRAGVNQLNQSLQRLAQGETFTGLENQGRRYAVGDKVMQMRNNYDLAWKMVKTGREGNGVMNGEMGLVTAIGMQGPSVTVLFEEERLALVKGEDLEDLDLAYATTIHKAQGSEYPTVILVVPPGSPAFLTRNLLYTGVTRARDRLFLLTHKKTLTMMLRNNEANERTGMLRFWLDH